MHAFGPEDRHQLAELSAWLDEEPHMPQVVLIKARGGPGNTASLTASWPRDGSSLSGLATRSFGVQFHEALRTRKQRGVSHANLDFGMFISFCVGARAVKPVRCDRAFARNIFPRLTQNLG